MTNKWQEFEVFVLGCGVNVQVFYDIEYFYATVSELFEILPITQEAYSEYQTAVLCRNRRDLIEGGIGKRRVKLAVLDAAVEGV
jgi:hypothetical protein